MMSLRHNFWTGTLDERGRDRQKPATHIAVINSPVLARDYFLTSKPASGRLGLCFEAAGLSDSDGCRRAPDRFSQKSI
jgi:hypothetical protein